MRKLILIALLAVGMMAGAQTHTTTGSTNGDASGTFWSSADTIAASESQQITIRVKGKSAMDLQFQLKTTKVAGTVTQNVIFSGSNDGVTFTNIDTIANTNASTNTQFLNIDDFNYSYIRVAFTNSATAQTAWFQCWYSFRYE
ncbi:MAG: hypothetical protein EOM59_13520 [Clostridia bacterium]|nr:hypothetical protein [Clostridia bacterium]